VVCEGVGSAVGGYWVRQRERRGCRRPERRRSVFSTHASPRPHSTPPRSKPAATPPFQKKAHLDRKVAADGPGLGRQGVGRADHLAAGRDDALALPDHGHHGAAADVVHQGREEGLGGEVGVVLLGEGLLDAQELSLQGVGGGGRGVGPVRRCFGGWLRFGWEAAQRRATSRETDCLNARSRRRAAAAVG